MYTSGASLPPSKPLVAARDGGTVTPDAFATSGGTTPAADGTNRGLSRMAHEGVDDSNPTGSGNCREEDTAVRLGIVASVVPFSARTVTEPVGGGAGGAGGAGALVVLLVTAIEQLACSFELGLTAPTLARLPRWCWRCCRCWAREEVEKRREEEAAAAPPAKGAEAAPATVSLALPALPKLVFPVGLVGFAAAWLLVLGVCQVQLQGAAPPLAALHGGGAVGMGAGAALLPQAM